MYGNLLQPIGAILSWRRMNPESPSLERIARASRDVVLTGSLGLLANKVL